MKLDTATMAATLQSYTCEMAEQVQRSNFALLSEIAAALIAAKERGATIFTAGNGGSAATASHICNDLAKGCRVENREGFKAECLVDSTPVLTCLANDFSYEDVFAIQLRTKAHRGDVLLVFSGSGNSPNIVRLLQTAREMGVFTIGFGGRNGGKMKPLCDLLLIAPTQSMEQLEDMHMLYAHALAYTLHQTLQDRFGIEYIHYRNAQHPITTALFDWDGTVSLIRQGWRDVMVPYFVEVLSALKTGENTPALTTLVEDFVDELTGKQTIFQCIRLAEEVAKRGGQPLQPLTYKQEYLRRLEATIAHRVQALQEGSMQPDEAMVPGSRQLLELLSAAGVHCHLASGTDEEDVRREAALLKVDHLFAGIHGARDEQQECSKEQVLQELFATGTLSPHQLVAFGDGYVEIELVHQLGGYTYGVASDEYRRMGISQWKRQRLLKAGADAIIPDFAEAGLLFKHLTQGV